MSGEIFDDFPKADPKKTPRAQKSTEQLMKEMDEAAVLAATEFNKEFANWSARDVIAWWAKWYLKAGHKRLGRMMVAKSKGK
jgi:hypothetical protein